MWTQTQGGPPDECLRGECCHCVLSEDVYSGRLLSRAALHPQELCNVHVEKKDVHIDFTNFACNGSGPDIVKDLVLRT